MAETNTRKVIFLAILLLAVGFFYNNLGGSGSGAAWKTYGDFNSQPPIRGDTGFGGTTGISGELRCSSATDVAVYDENGALNYVGTCPDDKRCIMKSEQDLQGVRRMYATCGFDRRPTSVD